MRSSESYVDKAHLNWAHIAIALLVKHRFIDRILTTNFDPLLVQACALFDVFPAVYDLAASQLFKPENVPQQAIFYLHGQRNGFSLLNTDDEFSIVERILEPLMYDVTRGRPVVVAGYSGECDPVFEVLRRLRSFGSGLFWIGYADSPSPHIREMLNEIGGATFLGGQDADDFFVSLASELEIFPPAMFASPFSHLKNIFDRLLPLQVNGTVEVDAIQPVMTSIQSAIDRFEPIGGNSGSQADDITRDLAQSLLAAGRYQDIIALPDAAIQKNDLAPILDKALILQASRLARRADSNKSPSKARQLYCEADALFQRVRISDGYRYGLYQSWGAIKFNQAHKVEDANERLSLFHAAEGYFRNAVSASSRTLPRAALADTLLHIADYVADVEQLKSLFDEAIELTNCRQRTAIDKDLGRANIMLAQAFAARARLGDSKDIYQDLALSVHAFVDSEEPDNARNLEQWASLLSDVADESASRAEAIKYLDESIEIYRRCAVGTSADDGAWFKYKIVMLSAAKLKLENDPDFDEKMKMFAADLRALIGKNVDSSIYFGLSKLFLFRAQHRRKAVIQLLEQAQRYLDEAIKLRPKATAYLGEAASVARRIGDLSKPDKALRSYRLALRWFERASVLSPPGLAPNINVAVCEMAMSDLLDGEPRMAALNRAAELLEGAKDRNSQDLALVNLVACYYRMHAASQEPSYFSKAVATAEQLNVSMFSTSYGLWWITHVYSRAHQLGISVNINAVRRGLRELEDSQAGLAAFLLALVDITVGKVPDAKAWLSKMNSDSLLPTPESYRRDLVYEPIRDSDLSATVAVLLPNRRRYSWNWSGKIEGEVRLSG